MKDTRIRSSKQQLSDELHAMHKRMTDPDEREKAAITRRREGLAEEQRSGPDPIQWTGWLS